MLETRNSRLAVCAGICGLMLVACGPSRKAPQAAAPADHSAEPAARLSQAVAAKAGSDGDNHVLAPVRGYSAVNRILSDRFTSQGAGTGGGVDLRLYLEADTLPPLPGSPALTDLLGVYAEDGQTTTMANAHPNGVGMLLWYLAIDGFAAAVADTCALPPPPSDRSATLPPPELILNPAAVAAVTTLCNWPLKTDVVERTLEQLWSVGMQADAPEAELDAWLSFAMSSDFTARGPQAVHDLVLTMLYSPDFLVAK